MRMGKTTDAAYKAAIGNDYHRVRLDIALDLLRRHAPRPGRAFDFGCGEGAFMRRLRAEGWTVTGCDVSAELTPDDAVVGGVDVIEALPATTLDLLVVLNVWSYLTDDEESRFWPAARNALRTGSLLLMCNPNGLAAAARYPQNTDAARFPDYLADHGFTEIEQDFFRTYPPAWRRLLLGDRDRIIDRGRLSRLPLGYRRRRSTGYFSLSRRDH
jgi:hypothetical protein